MIKFKRFLLNYSREIFVAFFTLVFLSLFLCNFFPNAPFQIKYGLDLKGGASLVINVDIEHGIQQELKTKVTALNSMGFDSSLKGHAITTNNTTVKKLFKVMPDMHNTQNGNNVISKFTKVEIGNFTMSIMRSAVEKIRKRVDKIGVSQSSVYQIGDNNISVEVPGIYDIKSLKSLLGKTGTLEFFIGRKKWYPNYTKDPKTKMYISNQPFLTGNALKSANVTLDNLNRPSISLQFNNDGAIKFAKITSKNVGNLVLIKLDGSTVTSGVIREAITGGNAQISGIGAMQRAREIVVTLNAGALPAKVSIISDNFIKPTISAIIKKISAILFGCAILITYIFIVFRYGLSCAIPLASSMGFIALAISGMLTFISATLTLYGIAAIILTIGMAIDSNIIILEEFRTNKSRGWNNAYSAIMTANATTLVASLCLMMVGYGPMKGFGITMTIGVLATMFTASTVLKMQFDNDKNKKI